MDSINTTTLDQNHFSTQALSDLYPVYKMCQEPIFVITQVDLVCHLFAIVPLMFVWIRHGLKSSGG